MFEIIIQRDWYVPCANVSTACGCLYESTDNCQRSAVSHICWFTSPRTFKKIRTLMNVQQLKYTLWMEHSYNIHMDMTFGKQVKTVLRPAGKYCAILPICCTYQKKPKRQAAEIVPQWLEYVFCVLINCWTSYRQRPEIRTGFFTFFFLIRNFSAHYNIVFIFNFIDEHIGRFYIIYRWSISIHKI